MTKRKPRAKKEETRVEPAAALEPETKVEESAPATEPEPVVKPLCSKCGREIGVFGGLANDYCFACFIETMHGELENDPLRAERLTLVAAIVFKSPKAMSVLNQLIMTEMEQISPGKLSVLLQSLKKGRVK